MSFKLTLVLGFAFESGALTRGAGGGTGNRWSWPCWASAGDAAKIPIRSGTNPTQRILRPPFFAIITWRLPDSVEMRREFLKLKNRRGETLEFHRKSVNLNWRPIAVAQGLAENPGS